MSSAYGLLLNSPAVSDSVSHQANSVSVRFLIVLLFFNMTGVHAVRTLLTLYAIELHAPPLTIGLLAAAFGVIPIMFSWLSGRLADRFGSRWLMLFGVAGSACGILLPYFMPNLAVIIIAGMLNGLTDGRTTAPRTTAIFP